MKIKSLLSAVLGAALLFILSGCGEKKPVLHLYNWTDYVAPELIAEFEAEFNCVVVEDFFESNESMYAKIKAGASGYDIVFPSSYQVEMMKEEGLLLPIDAAQVPNLQYIDPFVRERFLIDPSMTYSVPYFMGTTGIAYDSSKVEDFEPTWAMYKREDLAGRITLLDDGREVLGAALKYLGYSLNTTNPEEINAAVEELLKWRENLAKFGTDDAKQGLDSGEFVMIQHYSGDMFQLIDENENIEYVLPKEGFTVWVDEMAILKDAPNPELAMAYINFIHRPDVAKRNMEYVWYKCPNTAIYDTIDEELKEDPAVFMPAEVLEKAELIRPLGEANRLYEAAWDRVVSGY